MQKLIKLSDQHYVVVDDSEIKKGWVTNGVECFLRESMPEYSDEYANRYWKNITHSTQPLGTPLLFTNAFESELSLSINGLNETFIENWGCKKLSLSEVEEAINGYSVEEFAWNNPILSRKDVYDLFHKVFKDRRLDGEFSLSASKQIYQFDTELREISKIKSHQVLVKDKLFTVDDMRKAFEAGIRCTDWIDGRENFIQSLLPKTEWDIEIDEQGKIKL